MSDFNNISKRIHLNLYHVFFCQDVKNCAKKFSKFVNDRFQLSFFQTLVMHISNVIGAVVINSSFKEFLPHGLSYSCIYADPLAKTGVAHLDKSHIALHTYPDVNQVNGLCVFRTDLDISTCGTISPLNALSHLFEEMDPDVVVMDYAVRGFNRNDLGEKIFSDDLGFDVNKVIQTKKYSIKDPNTRLKKGTHHMSFMKKDVEISKHLISSLDVNEEKLKELIFKEMDEISNGLAHFNFGRDH
jgi:S-adenosylmethionine decarboxylase